MICLSNGLSFPEDSYKTPFVCVRPSQNESDIFLPPIEVESLQENDYLLLSNKVQHTSKNTSFRYLMDYSKSSFRHSFPNDSNVYSTLKKFLRKDDLSEKEAQTFANFVEHHNFPFDPDELAIELSKIFVGHLEDTFDYNHPLHQMACIITLKYAYTKQQDKLDILYYQGLPSEYSKDLLFFFDTLGIAYKIEEDVIEVICEPFLEFYRYFFEHAIQNLSLKALDKLLKNIQSVTGNSFKLFSDTASECLVRSSLYLHLIYPRDKIDSCMVLYKDSDNTIHISTIGGDFKRLYSDFIVDDNNLYVRVL